MRSALIAISAFCHRHPPRATVGFLLAALLGGCDDRTGPDPQPDRSSVTLTPTRTTIAAFHTILLAATVRDAAGTAINSPSVTWTSSDPAVATAQPSPTGSVPWVAFATVVGVSPGSVTITATSGTASAKATVTVSPSLSPPGLASAIVSDPTTSAAAPTTASVAYVSLRPGSFANGERATVTNRRTGASLALDLVAGGLDPVPVAAEAGDTLAFAIDTGGAQPIDFTQPVPVSSPPTVVRTEPPAGKQNVAQDVGVRIVFSEPVSPGTLTNATLELQQQASPLNGTVEVSTDGLVATFVPATALLPKTAYTILVRKGIRDTDGSHLEAPVTAGFTTGAAPPPPPVSGVLAFKGYDGDIHLINADGRGLRNLTTDGRTYISISPAWSPRGDRIAFVRTLWNSNSPWGIYVINADGTKLVRLSPSGVYDMEPAWSPDGQRIAFVHRSDPLHGNDQIYVMNADGTNRVPLTSLRHGAWSPTWSPTGGRIAFVSYPDSGSNTDIFVMDTDGRNLSAVTHDAEWDQDPEWSPDGSRIVFAKWSGGVGDFFLVNPDGTNLERLTTGANPVAPAWSPDGLFVATVTHNPGCGFDYTPCNGEIWIVRVADGTRLRLTSGSGPNWGP